MSFNAFNSSGFNSKQTFGENYQSGAASSKGNNNPFAIGASQQRASQGVDRSIDLVDLLQSEEQERIANEQSKSKTLQSTGRRSKRRKRDETSLQKDTKENQTDNLPPGSNNINSKPYPTSLSTQIQPSKRKLPNFLNTSQVVNPPEQIDSEEQKQPISQEFQQQKPYNTSRRTFTAQVFQNQPEFNFREKLIQLNQTCQSISDQQSQIQDQDNEIQTSQEYISQNQPREEEAITATGQSLQQANFMMSNHQPSSKQQRPNPFFRNQTSQFKDRQSTYAQQQDDSDVDNSNFENLILIYICNKQQELILQNQEQIDPREDKQQQNNEGNNQGQKFSATIVKRMSKLKLEQNQQAHRYQESAQVMKSSAGQDQQQNQLLQGEGGSNAQSCSPFSLKQLLPSSSPFFRPHLTPRRIDEGDPHTNGRERMNPKRFIQASFMQDNQSLAESQEDFEDQEQSQQSQFDQLRRASQSVSEMKRRASKSYNPFRQSIDQMSHAFIAQTNTKAAPFGSQQVDRRESDNFEASRDMRESAGASRTSNQFKTHNKDLQEQSIELNSQDIQELTASQIKYNISFISFSKQEKKSLLEGKRQTQQRREQSDREEEKISKQAVDSQVSFNNKSDSRFEEEYQSPQFQQNLCDQSQTREEQVKYDSQPQQSFVLQDNNQFTRQSMANGNQSTLEVQEDDDDYDGDQRQVLEKSAFKNK